MVEAHDYPHAPPWLDLVAGVVRRLPRGRYRAMDLVGRRLQRPFIARMAVGGRGVRYVCDARNSLAREAYLAGRYEPQETCLVDAILRPGDTFVDVGANWGYFTLRAAALVGTGGRVVSVEADPRMYSVLAGNVDLNGFASVTALHLAAADGPGELVLQGYDPAGENWGISRVDPDARGDRAFRVAADSVDHLLDDAGVDEVSLLKMDIEGAEAFALPGMRAGLEAHRYRRVLLELHPAEIRALNRDPAPLVERLVSAGYRALRIDHSPAAFRRAAYATRLEPGSFLSPSEGVPTDPWPHHLWLAPGVAPPA